MNTDANNYSIFGQDLVQKVAAYRKKHGQYANGFFWIKAFCLLGFWFTSYLFIVFIQPGETFLNFLLAMAWGVVSLLLVFNVGHDAVHGVISKRKWANDILQYVFNLSGGNAYSWRLKHNLAHHLHTNIEGRDFDTELTPLMRLSSESKPFKHYRYQHIYWIFIYPLLSLLVIGIGDFLIFFQTRKAGLVKSHAFYQYFILVLSKAWYLFIVFGLPYWFGNYQMDTIILVFLSIHAINGLIIAIVFMPSHYFPGVAYYSHTKEKNNWFQHQLSTTMDLSPDNKIVGHLLGGLNLNVSHHLFSNFCHVHYLRIKDIIRSCAADHGISLHQMNYGKALLAHIRHLKSLGQQNV